MKENENEMGASEGCVGRGGEVVVTIFLLTSIQLPLSWIEIFEYFSQFPSSRTMAFESFKNVKLICRGHRQWYLRIS